MPLTLCLAWKFWRGNPWRTLLTALAMMAAASVVSWIVSSYDALFSQFNDDSERVAGRFDLLLIATPPHALADSLLQRVRAMPAADVAERREFSQPLPVNARKQGEPAAGGGGRRSGVVTEPGGGRRGRRAGALAPVVYGLPGGGGVALVGVEARTPPYPLLGGHWLESSSADFSAVVSQAVAQRLQAGVGDRLEIASHGGFYTLDIIGVMEDGPDVRKFSRLRPDLRASAVAAGILVSPAMAARMGGGPLGVESVMLTLRPGIPLKPCQESLVAVAGEALVVDLATLQGVLDQPAPGSDYGRRLTQAWSATAVSMLVAFFIIFTTLSMGVEERIRQLAILRATALQRWQIAVLVLWESFFYGLIGWGGGLASGWLLLQILRLSGRSSVPLQIGVWTVTLTGVCSLFGAVAAAALPMWRAARVQVLEAMRPQLSVPVRRRYRLAGGVGLLLLCINPVLVSLPLANERHKLYLYALAGCPAMVLAFVCLAPAVTAAAGRLLRLPLAAVLRLHPVLLRSQLESNLGRLLGTVIALSVGLGFYMMTVIWSASMLAPFLPGAWMPECFAAIIPGGISAERAAAVAAFPEVRDGQALPVAVEQVRLRDDLTGSRERASVVRQDNVTFFGIEVSGGLSGDNPLLPFQFVSGERQQALRLLQSEQENYCLIPDYFARTAHLAGGDGGQRPMQVGDRFTVLTPEETPVEFIVAGVIHMPGWHWFSKFSGTRRRYARTAAMIFASYPVVSRAFGLDRVNYLWMNLHGHGEALTGLRSRLEVLAVQSAGESYRVFGTGGSGRVGRQAVSVLTRSELHQSLHSRTEMLVDGMLRMPLLILLVVSLSVANTALASVRARRREIGIMRACGLTSWGLFRLLLAEVTVIAAAAILLSFGFGLISGLCSARMAEYSSFFGGMGWSFAVPWRSIGHGAAVTTGLCLLAALLPAWFWSRQTPLALLQTGQE